MIGFRLGDLWTDTFTYPGASVLASRVSLKARLLFVSWIQVDGKLVCKGRAQADRADDRDPEVHGCLTRLPPGAKPLRPEPARRRRCR